jgi:FAD/FMN-containing dehydrogenase
MVILGIKRTPLTEGIMSQVRFERNALPAERRNGRPGTAHPLRNLRSILDQLAKLLAEKRRELPVESLASLERDGIVSRSGPKEFQTNFGKTFTLRPILWARPRNQDELIRAVVFAYQQGLSIKPIGSLCTWSPAARPEERGVALLTDKVTGVEYPDWQVLKDSVPCPVVEHAPVVENTELIQRHHLMRVSSGTTIWELNDALDQRGLALKTMGAYGGERVGGAFSTGTHGSSVFFGPMSDSVVSLDLVWQGVAVRVEQACGPTDPERFRNNPAHRDWLLVQQDDLFHAARLSYGMLGVALSYLIDVGPRYYLEERREEIGRARARREIRDVVRGAPGNVYTQALSAEYYFNLYSTRQEPKAIRVERRLIHPSTGLQAKRRTFDEFLFRFLRAIKIDPGRLSTAVFKAMPRLVPAILESGLAGLKGTFRSASYLVYNMGAQYIDAYLDDCHALAQHLFENHRKALTSPIGVRFIKPSRALLAIQQRTFVDKSGTRRPVELWAMVNFTLTIGTPTGRELMRAFHDTAEKYAGRSHPGKCYFDEPTQVRRSYDLDRFLEIRQVVDPEGLFLNAWNRRLLDLPAAPAVKPDDRPSVISKAA